MRQDADRGAARGTGWGTGRGTQGGSGRPGKGEESEGNGEPEVLRYAAPAEREAGARAGRHAGGHAGHSGVEPLLYLSADGEEPAAEEAGERGGEPEQARERRLAAQEAEWQARLEAARREARVEGRAEGRADMENERMELLRQCAAQWTEAVGSFAQARDGYFARVEREVVDLALAIAARILQREAQVDPLLLAGAVRVALGQLAETTTVELRVPAADRELWSETLRLMPNLPVLPAVVADGEMKPGECVLTTELGRVDLGARAQLKEIERGFFDLLSHRDSVLARDQARAGA